MPRFPRPAPLEWVLLAGGLGLVLQYRWLFDDAFVYFRYVDHFVLLDAGLVYNAGEYVEGYSSPLHCLLLIGLRSLHLSYPVIVIGLGCVSFAVFGYGLVVLNRRLSPADAPVLNLPLALLALNYGVASFFTSGLETPLEHVMAVAVALYFVSPRSVALAAVVALAPLVRPELALALVAAALFAWLRTRRIPWALLAFGAAANGAWLLFRIDYYADLLPNTFYLKNDTQPGLGLAYLWDFARPHHVIPLTLLGAGLLVLAARRDAPGAPLRWAPRLAMAATALAVAGYVVKIGGGALHYWYLSFAFPLFVCAFAGAPELALVRLGLARRRLLAEAALLAIALLVLAGYPRQLASHPLLGRPQHRPIGVISDAAWHRQHPTLGMGLNRARDPLDDLLAFAPELERDGYVGISESHWCRWIWKHPRERVVHAFGLTDAFLARVDAPELKPGHKPALDPLARQMVEMARNEGAGPGMFRRAVEAGRAPDWVRRNLESIEVIERKVYNRHDLAENLALAASFPRIRLAPGDVPRPTGLGSEGGE